MLRYSNEVKKYPQTYLIGIDEVGRGPIAGPVTIGVFCVEQKNIQKVFAELEGITDSKKLTAKKREYYLSLVKPLKQRELCNYATASVGASVIDTKGISYAINTAMKRALKKLNVPVDDAYLFLDGSLYAPTNYLHQETIIKGDANNQLIATASVIAKVTRDSLMVRYTKKHPHYLFDIHKGYGTKKHYEMLRKHGVCTLHRKKWIKD